MGKTIILGNENSQELAKEMDASLIEFSPVLGNNYDTIADFIKNNLQAPFDILAVDADNIDNDEQSLAIGLYVRLSVLEIGNNALVPIVIISDKSIKQFLHYKTYSQILITRAVYFQSRTNIVTDSLPVLKPSEYIDGFLDFIHIQSSPEYGNHSLANQWGASVVDRLLSGGVLSDEKCFSLVVNSLYFKYLMARTTEINDLLMVKKSKQYLIKNNPINAKGRHVLLVDDEADKGWEYVLKKMILTYENDFNVVKNKTANYSDIPDSIRSQIENGVYDLVLLDLRMNGVEEESVYKPDDFSGMKILKEIKKHSIGTQVIMLTASNKAWNLKALFEAGADGYYMKESPEYNFGLMFSNANFSALRDCIEKCLKRSVYLKEADRQIKSIRKNLLHTKYQQDFKNSIVKQIESSFVLLRNSYFEFAYVNLYQTIELINEHYLNTNNEGQWYITESNQIAKSWSITKAKNECREESFSEDDVRKFPEWKKMACLYYQLWQQTDLSFGARIRDFIKIRNQFLHNDPQLNPVIHKEDGYMRLLNEISTICQFV